jgi:hypothetical protein
LFLVFCDRKSLTKAVALVHNAIVKRSLPQKHNIIAKCTISNEHLALELHPPGGLVAKK